MTEAPSVVIEDDEPEAVLDDSQVDDEGLISIGESSLSYFGADFDVAGLVRRLRDEDIVVPRFDPDETSGSEIDGFQRQRVWTGPRMEKFIESLLLGWPVPSIFLVLEKDQRYLVLDGQQRLTALLSFYEGRFPDGRKFALHDVADHLKGATYDTLSKESRRRINNTFIQAIVIEPVGDDGPESVYRLFGRLNSGGMTLTAQEIRVALFRGRLVEWIRDLNHTPSWRRLFGAIHKRLKDHELILRSLSLVPAIRELDGRWGDIELTRSVYRPPMADFLNAYLTAHRDLENLDSTALGAAFVASADLLLRAVGPDALRYNGVINAAHVDAVMSTLIWAHMSSRVPADAAVKSAINSLRDSVSYHDYVTRSTSHRESVLGRLKEADSEFHGV